MRAGSRSDARRLADLSAVATVAFAIAIGLVANAAGRSGFGPPQAVPRGIALAVLFATPGLIGWLGARARRSSLLVAAATLCALQSVVAFSGITLVFLVPALGFARAATLAAPRTAEADHARPVRRGWTNVLLIASAVPLALLVVRFAGVAGVVALIAVAAIAAPGCRRLDARAVRGAAVAASIVALGVAAAIALLATTEEVCWIARSDGSYVRVPPTDSITLGEGEVAGGCDGGELTTRGAVLAGSLAGAAVLVAAAISADKRRGRPASARDASV